MTSDTDYTRLVVMFIFWSADCNFEQKELGIYIEISVRTPVTRGKLRIGEWGGSGIRVPWYE